MVSAADGQLTMPWRESAETAARRLAAITLPGTVLGVLVGGVGGRLAMMLLAALNPRAAGVTSDDGFTIGQFTIGERLSCWAPPGSSDCWGPSPTPSCAV